MIVLKQFHFLLQCICFMALCFPSISESTHRRDESVHIAVVTLSYNNIAWYNKNLDSLFSQEYSNWTLYYVNDVSTDGTGEAVAQKIAASPFREKCLLKNNTVRQGALANLYNTIKNIDPRSIVVLLDGDDAFAHKNVLQRVAEEYKKHDAWLTYGSYVLDPGGQQGTCSRPLPKKALNKNSFRSLPGFYTSHLKTFYAKLFQSIKVEDLQHEGQFFRGGWDLIIMFPMLEMAGKGHIRFIPDILYLYNTGNQISDHIVHSDEQAFANKWVRSQKPYKLLKHLF